MLCPIAKTTKSRCPIAKFALPEIFGHLKDHCKIVDGTLLRWLFPREELGTGLRVLMDDKLCGFMSDCISEGGVAEVYAEEPIVINVD